MNWRLIQSDYNDAFYNMAVDEAIFLNKNHYCSTLRLYGWQPAALSLGYFQKTDDIKKINLQQCRNLNIDLVRRITGGGTIFHNSEVTYSVITSIKENIIGYNITQAFQSIGESIIKGLKSLGIKDIKLRRHEIKEINPHFFCFIRTASSDIVVNNQKLVGSTQRRKKDMLLQHGSILIDLDLETMFSLLNEHSDNHLAKECFNQKVTSLTDILGKRIEFIEVSRCIVQGFEEHLGIKLIPGELAPEEQKLINELSEQKKKDVCL